MALKVDYVVKETATNLRRNVTLTFATIVTIAVTLAFAGAVRLIGQGVNRAELKFKGGVQFIVFMNPDASQSQVDAVGASLNGNPQVQSTKYLDHDAAYAEFKDIFADKPEYYENITPAELPTSYKVVLKEFAGNSQAVLSLKSQYEKQPGVTEVAAAPEEIKKREEGFSTLRWVLVVGTVVIGGASLVLIVNSIRIAMFARRREIEVMKLVGATNWFIRVPFMAEGLLQGLFGSLIGIGIVWGAKSAVLPALSKTGGLFAGFQLSTSDVWTTSILLAIGGAFVGVAGSGVAATRFLDV